MKKLLLSLLFTTATFGQGAVSVVQQVERGHGSQVTTINENPFGTFASSQAAGDANVVVVEYCGLPGGAGGGSNCLFGSNATGPIASVTDTAGNTYVHVCGPITSVSAGSFTNQCGGGSPTIDGYNVAVEVWYAPVIKAASGGNVVTANMTTTANMTGYNVWLFQLHPATGSIVFDQFASKQWGTHAAQVSGPLPNIAGTTGTTTHANEFVFGYCMTSNGTCPSNTSGWSTAHLNGSTFYDTHSDAAYEILSSTGTASVGFTAGSGVAEWYGLIVTFGSAGNVCPAGNQTINPDGSPQSIANVGITVPLTGSITSCFYSSTSGSDSNSGADEAHPWAHVPGMTGCSANCSSHTAAAGDGYIIRGGETYSATTITPPTSGSSTHPIYYGVDQTWFAGASWTRPVLTGTSSDEFNLVNRNWVIIDNLEITGMTNSVNGCRFSGGSNSRCTQLYFHNWSYGGSGSNNVGFFSQMGSGSMADHNVADGSDSIIPGPSGSCTVSSCGTFNGVYSSAAGTVQYNYFGNMVSCILATVDTVNGNLCENTLTSVTGDHCNGIFTFGPQSGTTIYVYNNIVRKVGCSGGVNFWLTGNGSCPTCTSYGFNNIIEASVVSGNPFNVGKDPYATGTHNVFNNTVSTLNNSYCFGNGSSGASSTTNYGNNHSINTTVVCLNTGTTCVNKGGNISQTLSVANAQGYSNTQTEWYSPTLNTNATVGAGVNQAALCVGSVVPLCTSTAYPVYNATNHTMGVSNVSPAGVSRGTTWDAGAFQFATGGTSPIASFSPNPLAIGQVPVGLTSNASATVTLQNTGTANLVVTAVTPGAIYALVNNTCGTSFTLTPGASCTFQVTATPVSAISFTGGITFSDNAGNPDILPVTGTGTGSPAPAVTIFSGNVVLKGAVTK